MNKSAVIFLLLAIIFSACQQHRALSDAIAAADAVVCTAPDSALAILARADTTDAPARLLAHYTLLTEKASDKADIVHTDDSLITAAARYYEGRNDSLEAQALYYKGVVQFNNRDFGRALISLMQAHEVADNANDRFYKAMSSRTLSDVYNKLLAFDAAARCDSMAIVEFYEAGRPDYAMIEEIYLPYYYIQSGRFKEADSILDSNSKNSFFFETPEKTSWYYQTRALSHFNRGRYSVSALWYDSCLQITPAYVSSRTWARAALAHIELGNIESATKLLDLARARATDSEDTLYYNLTKARLAAIKDDFKYAYKLQDSIYCNYNVVRNKLLSHPYATVLTDYFKTLSDDRQQTVLASRHKIYFLSIIVILLIILLVTAFILYRRRRQLDDIMKDSLISDIQKLKQDLESLSVQDREKSVSPATTPVLSDYDSSCNDNIFVKLLDELFSKEHISPSSANVNARHHRSFQTILAKLKSESSLREIEALANLYNGNLIERLRKEVPRMTQFQLNYFSLMMLGFSNSSICYVLDVTNVKAIHQLRSRIKTRIEESESDDKKLFLSSLKK